MKHNYVLLKYLAIQHNSINNDLTKKYNQLDCLTIVPIELIKMNKNIHIHMHNIHSFTYYMCSTYFYLSMILFVSLSLCNNTKLSF